MKKAIFVLMLAAVLLAACAPKTGPGPAAPGMGMGRGGGMMERHHAAVPEGYAGLQNPVAADAASLERGEALYAQNCASCHGDGGMGDGPAGEALDPAPASVAHSSQMLADDYLFWRLSEGGEPFGTTMPGWKTLDEQARWDMINYMRALGAGTVRPRAGQGGAAYDPTVQAERQAAVLAEAVQRGVVTQAEADTFRLVHDAAEQYRVEHPELANSYPDAARREAAILDALVKAGTITQAQAGAFGDIHDRLGAADLMP